MKTFAPPPELADAALAALVLPFDEQIDAPHDHAGLSYRWGDVPLPRRHVPIDVDHDVAEEVGFASSFVLTDQGIWAALKLGRRGRALLEQGYTGVSPTIEGDQIVGVSLTRNPGFPSARIVLGDDLPAGRFAGRYAVRFSSRSVTIGPSDQRTSPTRTRVAMDLTEHRRGMQALSMQPVEAEVEHRRREFERRQEELAEQDVLDEQLRLVAEGRPVALWPAHLPQRKAYDAMSARQRAEEIADEGACAAREFAERMERLEAQAERARRPWWRWSK